MKKAASIVLVAVMIAVLLSSCAASLPAKEKVAAMTSEKATRILKDRTEKEIHDAWGDPDGVFSGFYGDIYDHNGKRVGIYYDGEGRVTDVRVFDKQT